MKISLFEVEPHERTIFAPLAEAHALRIVEQPLDAASAAAHADAEVVSGFIYSDFSAATLAQLPQLRLIATRSTGYDHIDLAYCARHGIAVCNVPSYGERTVAEHVFALLLAISHRLPEAIQTARSGRYSPRGLQGFDLYGKTFGALGTGRIGLHAVRIARGFGMRVLAWDLYPDAAAAAQLDFEYATLQQVLAQADVLSLHLPLTDATKHLIGADEFALMKPGAVLINTARGGLVEPGALIQALIGGRLAAAGLDVLPDEPAIREEAQLISSVYNEQLQTDLRGLVADHVLLNLPNVVVTPHSGFNTREAVQRIAQTTYENIAAYARGATQNTVPLPQPVDAASKST